MMEFDGIRKRDVEKKDIEERKSLQGKIKEYKLSDEELADIRKKTGWNRDEFNKEIYVQRKQEGKTDREIMKEFNLYPKKLNELKHEWKLIGVKEAEFLKMKEDTENKEQEVTKAEQQEEAVKPVPNEVSELQLRIKELEECEVQLSERNAYLETELTNLSDELERYKSTLTKERTEASDEYGRILKKNSELVEIIKELREEIEILKGDIEERDGEIEAYAEGMIARQTEIERLKAELKQRELLQSQLEQSDSESCQSCEKYQHDLGKLQLDINYLRTLYETAKEDLKEATKGHTNYKRKYNSAAFALKELIEVELFSHGDDEDARD